MLLWHNVELSVTEIEPRIFWLQSFDSNWAIRLCFYNISTQLSCVLKVSYKRSYLNQNYLSHHITFFCRSKGFILEGFPRNADEARYLSTNGLFPDGAITLNVEDTNIIERLMPPILQRWRERRARLLVKRERKRQNQLKIRVG